MKRRTKKKLQSAILYTVMIAITCYVLFPLLWALASSFRTNPEIYKYAMPFSIHTMIPVEPTLDAYRQLFGEFHFLRAIWNNLKVVLVLIPCGCLLNSVAAMAFTMFDFRFKNVMFAIFLVSFMIPFESIAIPLYQLVDKLGWIDTSWALIVPALANGMQLFLFRQFFRDLPISLLEAARVDGATWPQIYAKIIVPLSKPIFITAGLMIFVGQWNAHLWPLIAVRSEESRTIAIALTSLKLEEETLWNCLYAGSIVSALVPITLFLPLQKYFVAGITKGGVKG